MSTKKKPLTAGRISKLASNPGTRAALEDKFLSPAQLKQRQMNKRLDAPIVDGSATTNRDLSRQAQSAATLQFGGDPVQQAQQLATDRTGWYQQYQDQVNKLRGDVAANGAQAATAAQNITGAVGQLGAQTAVGDGQVRGDADKASAVRQALSASFGAMQASKGQNANNYAANLADVVVPGQKLTAQNVGAAGVKTAKDQLAAFLTKYKGDAIAGETTAQADKAKTNLAMQALGLDASKAAITAQQEGARIDETVRHNKTSEVNQANDPSKQKTAADLAFFKAHGYYPPTGPPKAAAKGKSGYLAPAGQNTFKRTFDSAVQTATKLNDHYSREELKALLRNGRQATTVFLDPATRKPIPDVYTLADAKKKNPKAMPVSVGAVAPITDEAILSAVLDKVIDGHLSPYTIAKLHKAKIKVNGLGVSTKKPRQTKASKIANDAISSVGSAVSGLGG